MAQPITNTVKNTFGFSTPTVSPFQNKGTTSPFQSAQTSGPMSVYTPPKATVATPAKSVTGVAKPTVQKAPQASAAPADNSAKIQELQGILAQKQSQLAGMQSPVSTPVTPTQPQGFPGLVSTLATRAQTPSPEVQESYDQAQLYNKQLTDFRKSVADTTQGIFSAPTSARVMQGRNQAVQLANAQKEAALGSQFEGASALYGTATTGQGQQLSALGTAAGLGQPSPAAFGQTVFDPLTGQYTGGGGLPAETMQQYAQMAASGQYASIPSSITSNPVLSAQLNQAAKAINPNFNPITSVAQGDSASDLTRQASEIQAIANGAEANFALLVDTARKGQVNDTTVPILNRLQQNVQRGLASAESIALFRATLESVRAQYASILGGGQATDQARTAANAQIPDDISLSALQALEKQLKFEAQNRVAGFTNQISSLTGGGNSGGGDSTTVGKYSYKLVNGKWVLAQ